MTNLSMSYENLFNATFRTPAPPNELFPMNSEHVFVSTLFMAILALLILFISIIDAKRYKSTVPIGIVLAAIFCVIPESIDNYLAGCYWSQSHNPNNLLFLLMGREFDYYVAIMWWAFGAILGYILYAILLRNVNTKILWIALLLAGISDIIIEEILLGYGGIYTYFGNQPLIILFNFPWWWLFANVSAIFLSVAIAYRFKEWFNGIKTLLIFILMPLCYIGAFNFAAMPTIFVINGNFSPLIIQGAGILTSIISVVQISGIMYFILGRNPFILNK